MLESLKTFWYWIKERESIRKMRARYPDNKPWSTDPIFQTGRFCNVFREDDKVTKWIRKHWRKPLRDQREKLFFAMCVARQINHIPTLEDLGPPDFMTPSRIEYHLADRYRRQEQIYGGAYIITAAGNTGPKYLYTTRKVLTPIWNTPPEFVLSGGKHSLQEMWSQLMKEDGFGKFMAYEVVTDLRWTDLYDGSDHMTWANAGPGAKRGLGRIFYDEPDRKIKDEECLAMMQRLLKHAPMNLPDEIGQAMEMRDIEHCLCEVDKYIRVQNNEGRMKCKFDGK